MMNVDDMLKAYKEDLTEVGELYDSIYNSEFKQLFSGVRQLYQRLQNDDSPITDKELEWAITDLPLTLFSISENVSKLRLDLEVVKLTNKRLKITYTTEFKTDMYHDSGRSLTSTEKDDLVKLKMLEHELVQTVYANVILQVEEELKFSKELIMGCKKVWDARRQTEQANPISEVNTELPDYKVETNNKSYIK